MPSNSGLRPTLWRTCRVLANRNRLRIFHSLLQQPDQTVSAIASRFGLSLSVASESLRLLESRSLLTARRTGKYVKYRVVPTRRDNPKSRLAAELRAIFHERTLSKASDTIFQLVTAFTHPRRIEIFRALRMRPRTFDQVQAATGVSALALSRHVKKLEARRFIECRDGLYSVVRRVDPLRRELMRLAAGDVTETGLNTLSEVCNEG
jgi:DNA-binding transcriptional ArsR family regulator